MNAVGGYPDGLRPLLRRLDRVLEEAVGSARTAYGPEAATDPFRGLYVDQDQVERLLTREPGAPVLGEGEDSEGGEDESIGDAARLEWLKDSFSLSQFDIDVLLVALAAELDLRYERVYAYLQNDVTRKRPSVDLALDLLCSSGQARIESRSRFGADAPLVRHGLLHLVPDPNQPEPSLLSHFLKLDEQVVRLLLGDDSLDSRLAGSLELIHSDRTWEDLPVAADTGRALQALVTSARKAGTPLRLYFNGPEGSGARRTAEAAASAAGTVLLAGDLEAVLASQVDFGEALMLAFREAAFRDAILYLGGLDALRGEDRRPELKQLLGALQAYPSVVILAGSEPWAGLMAAEEGDPLGVATVAFDIPELHTRLEHWVRVLESSGVSVSDEDVEALASRFRLTPAQIEEAVAQAKNGARWRSASARGRRPRPRPTRKELFAAARAQTGHQLGALAVKTTSPAGWSAIVLPADSLTLLREICTWVIHRQRVLGDWGFERRLALGRGVTALFAGPAGTGKTMAAQIIANELGIDLYKIDLSGVVSKYIGETEKNLDRIFKAAENANALLFIDECDALFGKRSEVRDSHDRYANIEISYLLQKMEEYAGLAILATNMRENLDEAFVRRLAFTVFFPFPEEDERRRIWAGIWPAEVPTDEIDLDHMAHEFRLSGGNIKNVALAAAFLAAEEGVPVSMDHLLHAVRREFEKMGKSLYEEELLGLEAPEESPVGIET